MKIPYDAPVAVGREIIELGSDVATAILLTLEAGWTHVSGSSDVHTGSAEIVITELWSAKFNDGHAASATRVYSW
jgi:hypothetical protein